MGWNLNFESLVAFKMCSVHRNAAVCIVKHFVYSFLILRMHYSYFKAGLAFNYACNMLVMPYLLGGLDF